MKRNLLISICLSVAAAFAGPYDISEFTAQDVGTPDDYITAEFGGELKAAPVEEVSSLQEGRLVVRQKFVDPFGEAPTTYQLYQGGAGDLSSMTALTAPEGTDYSKIVTAKIYDGRGKPADQDVEKVYFDGKSVFVPNLTSAIAFIDGTPITLKGDAPEEPAPVAAAAPSTDEYEECDEYDPDCEEEDEDEPSNVDVAGNLDESNAAADAMDNSANDAAYSAGGENATDRFGIADEVRFWTAVGLSALAATGAVLGVLQQMEANKAKDAYDDLDNLHSSIVGQIKTSCQGNANPAACEVALKEYANFNDGNGYSLANLESRMKVNKDTQDSYTTARNIWFAVTGVSLTAAIVLFVW